MSLHEHVSVAQPDVRDVIVHVDPHLPLQGLGDLLEITVVVEKRCDCGLEALAVKGVEGFRLHHCAFI